MTERKQGAMALVGAALLLFLGLGVSSTQRDNKAEAQPYEGLPGVRTATVTVVCRITISNGIPVQTRCEPE